jgi:5-methylcytosine-specific restriction enzyme A
MPSKPLRPCSQPGCPAIATAGGRCAAHQRPERKGSWGADRDRPNASERGYNDPGERRNRARFLKYNPACAVCGALATEAHHIVPKAEGGTGHWENLQALCKSCHSRITGRYTRERQLARKRQG